MEKFDNIKYFIKEHPIIFVLLLLLFFVPPIEESIKKWDRHPKRITCWSSTNKCSMETFAFKHEICWTRIFSSSGSRTGSYRDRCVLPKYKESVTDLPSLNEIQDVVVKTENNIYNVVIKGQNNKDVTVVSYKDLKDATARALDLKKVIKRWQNTVPDDSEKVEVYVSTFG